MSFPEDQHPVGHLRPGGEHKPVGIGVRPRALGRDLHRLDTDTGQYRVEGSGELPGPVADQEPEARGPITEVHQIADLLRGPRPVRVGGDPEDVHMAAADFHHEQAIQAAERHCAVHVKEVGGKHRRGLGVPSRPAARAMITERRWCPECVLDKTREVHCPHREISSENEPGSEDMPQTDVQRLRRCWGAIALIERQRALSPAAAESAGENAEEEGAAQLAAIQGLLAARGQTRAARQIYRMRKQYLRDCWRHSHPVKRWTSQATLLFSSNGSSPRRLLGSLALLYLVIIPAAWWTAWRLGAPVPLASAHGPLPAEALLFTLSSVANVSNGHFTSGGWLSSSLQVAEGLSAYFALGYLLAAESSSARAVCPYRRSSRPAAQTSSSGAARKTNSGTARTC